MKAFQENKLHCCYHPAFSYMGYPHIKAKKLNLARIWLKYKSSGKGSGRDIYSITMLLNSEITFSPGAGDRAEMHCNKGEASNDPRQRLRQTWGLFKHARNDGMQEEKIQLKEDTEAKREVIWCLRGTELGKDTKNITLLRRKWKRPSDSSKEKRPIRKDRRCTGWIEDDMTVIPKATGA